MPAYLVFSVYISLIYSFHSILTIIKFNLPKTIDVYKEYLNKSINEIYNNIHLNTKHMIIALSNVVFKRLRFQTICEK
jgi:hypothetical protein